MNDTKPVEVIFFDIRDTLGEIDRPGHLVPYRPSTEKLLSAMKDVVGYRIGLITNLPDDVTAAQGRQMIEDVVLSVNPVVKLKDFVDPKGIVINHEVGVSKPDPEIYRRAAGQMGVPNERCMFVGENLIEVLGASAAGMQTMLKPCPPGREFLPAVVTRLGVSDRYSGRAFEDIFEQEHLLGHRIIVCATRIVEEMKLLKEGQTLPAHLYTATGLLVYLTENFVDQHHLRAEEIVMPLAVARGLDPKEAEWVARHHDQGRAYFKGMSIAWERIQGDDPDDLASAIDAFVRCTEGFVQLFAYHGQRENDELFPEMGKYFNDTDDTLMINLIRHTGPPDSTPYIGIVSAMEQALGL